MTVIISVGYRKRHKQQQKRERKNPQTVQIMVTFSLSSEHLLKLFMCVCLPEIGVKLLSAHYVVLNGHQFTIQVKLFP